MIPEEVMFGCQDSKDERYKIMKIWDLDKFKDNMAVIDDENDSISYGDLSDLSSKLYSLTDARSLVFILCSNGIGSIISYVSCINNGNVPLLLNAELDEELLANLIGIYGPGFVFLPYERYQELREKGILADGTELYSFYGYVLINRNLKQKYELNPSLALLLTTSGSTGSPKFVRQSYENVRTNAESIVQYLSLDETERPITTLPMNYTYGLSIINSHLFAGGTLLATKKSLMQKEFWQFFREQKATSISGVPYTYEMLDRLRFTRMDLPSLRTMTQAGGKLIPELHKKFAEYARDNGKQFFVMYGQCEATARMGYLPADKAVEKCGSMGIAIPGGKFHLIDVNGEEITVPDTVGELVYEGENVTLGYAECKEDLTRGDERNGLLHTGDMARFDEDGYYYIAGRKKRFLKIYGNRVNLDEIDCMIKGKFENMDVASSGVDDHMYIFVTDESQADDVKNFVVSKTKLNPVAFKTVVIDEIPKNDAGKVLYQKLSAFYE